MDSPLNASGISRRNALALCAGASALLASPGFAAAALTDRRALTFHHLHTGEKISRVYWADGRYLAEPLRDITMLCRDFRTGDVHPIDREALDVVFRIQLALETTKPVEIISAYRSPKTNAVLAARSSGVAKRSFHMQGKALDIRIPGISSARVARAAISLDEGGVGLYSRSNFVHVDTGRSRRWGR